MANLTLRQVKGSALTIEELDGNFEYFTGSFTSSGSITAQGFIGTFTGSFSGSVSGVSTNALTASYVETAQTASYVAASNIDGTVENAATASYAVTSQTSSYVETLNQDVTISGLINFGDGSSIQSISASSGDGLGATTLELTPDTNLTTDQYIVLDPTAPNHIHIRAGGIIDESTSLLYLGGEKANVLVTDSNHQVQINSTSVDSSSFSWIFDNNGNTLFPFLTTQRGDISGGTLNTNTLKLGDGTNQAVITTPDGILPGYSSERLVINPGQGSGSGEGGDIYLWAGRGGVDGGSGGDIKVRGGYGPLAGDGGYIRIDGGDTQDGDAGYVLLRGGDSQTGAGGTVDIYGGFGNGNAQNGNVTITTYDTSGIAKTWAFGTDGTLTIPDLLQLPVRTTDPGTPVEGMIMASGSAGSSKLYYYDGTTWVDLTA